MSLLSLIAALFAHPTKASGVTITSTPPLNIENEILAIAGAENSEGKIGAHGERGRLQFTATRWYQFSCKPHRWAGWRHPFAIAETERVERAHVMDLIEQAIQMKMVPTPYVIALLHTAGATAVRAKTVGALKRDFAQRAENLYYANVPLDTAEANSILARVVTEARSQRNPPGSE